MKTALPVSNPSPLDFANLLASQPAPRTAEEELKSSLVRTLADEYAQVSFRLVRQAVNEAHALAATTPVPLLVLPALAEEKVRTAAAWSVRQHAILHDHQQYRFAYAV
jgi:hypothetical protein